MTKLPWKPIDEKAKDAGRILVWPEGRKQPVVAQWDAHHQEYLTRPGMWAIRPTNYCEITTPEDDNG